TAPCTYNGANRPTDLSIGQVVIHDVEGSAQDAISDFQDPTRAASVQYVVGSDGTVYQTLHEKDVPFGAGNFWYNEHSINIEHGPIRQQGVPMPATRRAANVITLHPATDRRPLGPNGTETAANFNFFYLYQGPSTASGLVPQIVGSSDVTDESANVEPDVSYPFLARVKDPAGTGDTMFEIAYGEFDQAQATPSSLFQTSHLAWLAVPPGTADPGPGTSVLVRGVAGGPAA